MLMHAATGKILAEEIRVADSFFSRLKGLLGTSGLAAGRGLVITPCNSVHTFGMRYSIDVLFVNKEHTILKIVPDMLPGKIALCRGSRYVVELPSGAVLQQAIYVGDKIFLRK